MVNHGPVLTDEPRGQIRRGLQRLPSQLLGTWSGRRRADAVEEGDETPVGRGLGLARKATEFRLNKSIKALFILIANQSCCVSKTYISWTNNRDPRKPYQRKRAQI